MFVSRDFVFHENVFPFHSASTQSGVDNDFPNIVLPINQPDLTSVTLPLADMSNLELTLPGDTPAPVESVHDSVTRRSTRTAHPPTYLKYYQCNLLTHGVPPTISPHDRYPISISLNYDELRSSFKAFVLNVSSHYEPQFYHQAVLHSEWRETMRLELQAMESNCENHRK